MKEGLTQRINMPAHKHVTHAAPFQTHYARRDSISSLLTGAWTARLSLPLLTVVVANVGRRAHISLSRSLSLSLSLSEPGMKRENVNKMASVVCCVLL